MARTQFSSNYLGMTRAVLLNFSISIGNSVISSDIWHKYQEWYFEIVIRNFTSR